MSYIELDNFEKEFISCKCKSDLDCVEFSDGGFETKKEFYKWRERIRRLELKMR